MADATLEIQGVVKEYGAGEVATRVLHGVDLRLGRGEFTALMGPSGSGKSTLLNLVGLLDRPTAGRIVLEGRDTGALDDRALTRYRGRTLGFIFRRQLPRRGHLSRQEPESSPTYVVLAVR